MKKLTILFIISLLLTGAGCTFKKSVSLNDVIDAPEVEDIQEQPIDDAQLDSDNDGLTNAYETNTSKTDPYDSDTDGDGYSDGQEIEAGYDPTKAPDATTTVVEDGSSPVDQTTSTFDCGTDISCFDEKFSNCEPAIMTASIGDWAAVSYEITESATNGCAVTMTFTTNPNPVWENQPMYCIVDNSQDFESAIASTLNADLETEGICTGPLHDIIHAD